MRNDTSSAEKTSDNNYHINGFVDINKKKQLLEKIKKTLEQINFFRTSIKSKHSDLSFRQSSKNVIRKEIKIILCDDEFILINTTSRLIRETCKNLNLIPNIQIYNNGIELLYNIYNQLNKNFYYDIVIIDETMPYMKGSYVIKIIKIWLKRKGYNRFQYILCRI